MCWIWSCCSGIYSNVFILQLSLLIVVLFNFGVSKLTWVVISIMFIICSIYFDSAIANYLIIFNLFGLFRLSLLMFVVNLLVVAYYGAYYGAYDGAYYGADYGAYYGAYNGAYYGASYGSYLGSY